MGGRAIVRPWITSSEREKNRHSTAGIECLYEVIHGLIVSPGTTCPGSLFTCRRNFRQPRSDAIENVWLRPCIRR